MSHISFEDFLCASAPCAILSYIITSKFMFGQFFFISGFTFPLKWLCKTAGAIFILYTCGPEDFNKYSSKFSDNFKWEIFKKQMTVRAGIHVSHVSHVYGRTIGHRTTNCNLPSSPCAPHGYLGNELKKKFLPNLKLLPHKFPIWHL